MKVRANIQMQKVGATLVFDYIALLPTSNLERQPDRSQSLCAQMEGLAARS